MTDEEEEEEYAHQMAQLTAHSIKQDEKAWKSGFNTGCALCLLAFTLVLLINKCIA